MTYLINNKNIKVYFTTSIIILTFKQLIYAINA